MGTVTVTDMAMGMVMEVMVMNPLKRRGGDFLKKGAKKFGVNFVKICRVSENKKLAISGVFWNAVQMIVNQMFSFGIRLLLAKLLLPQDFGVVGMAMVFTGFIQILNELGIGAALVQKKEENLTASHYNTAFWTGVIWSVTLFAIVCLLAPFVASFYKQPILKSIIPFISIGILLSPINLVNKAQLLKRLDFKRISKIDSFANIVAGTLSLVLALSGAGVWSLVFNSLTTILVAIPFYFNATKWYPKLVWNQQAFRDIFGFGIYTMGTNIINFSINNVDYLLIGKLLSAQVLGIYTFAFVLTDTFKSKLVSVINTVMYPLYSKNQDNVDAAKRIYLKTVEYNCIIVYPIMFFMLVLGEPFIIQVFGDKWQGAVQPLRVLSISVMIQMLVNSNTALVRGLGRADFEFKLQIFKMAIYIPSIIIGTIYYGMMGAAYAILLNRIFAIIITQAVFSKILNLKISPAEFYNSFKVPLLAGIVSSVFAFGIFQAFNFIISGIVLMGAFSVVIYYYKKTEVVELLQLIRKKKDNG